MSFFREGYPEGIEYTHGYQAELNPLRLSLALLNVGLPPPRITTACELGFGQGETTNLHAAASTTQWFGTDFNAAHAAHAREMAAASGAAAHFFDESFADFCHRTDLPDFDFIALHGVWSWVSDQNRRIIVDFVDRKLRDGGVLYVGYNTLPGHAGFLPIQELLTRSVELHSKAGGIESALHGAMEFAEKVLTASPLYAQRNAHAASCLGRLASANRLRPEHAYLAHEYINREWEPMSFARLAEWLAPAKLTYACSARYFDMVDGWNHTADQRVLLKEIADLELRETVRDLMVNQAFRKDYWIKGARQLTVPEIAEGLRRQRVVRAGLRSGMWVEAVGALGRFKPPQSVSDPILEVLADGRPKSLREIEQLVRDRGVDLAKIVNLLLTLVETAAVCPVQEETVVTAARRQTDRLNAYLCDRARRKAAASLLASPVIGTGVFFEPGRLVQFFWQAVQQGRQQPGELAAHAAQIFNTEGLSLLEEEKRFVPGDGGFVPLLGEATFFIENLLPLLKALQIL